MDLSCFSNSSLLSLSYPPEGKHRNCERKFNVSKHDTIAPGVFKLEPLDLEFDSLTIQRLNKILPARGANNKHKPTRLVMAIA